MDAGGYCAQCGASHERGQRYCYDCGQSLADEDPWIGATLGRYEIQRAIASGGMGAVYAAHDPQLGRTVALKLLRDDIAADDEFRQRFVRESRAAASLDHPNILPVFDAGEVDGVLYLATRLVEARDLRQLLIDEGELSIERTLTIIAQVAAALDFAHERDIVHRDVKPANLLVVPGSNGDSDHAYLIDFGITKRSNVDHTLTASGMFVGSPEYAAPEQASGASVDRRADQYSLACVMYHCLAGAPPFSASNAIDVLHAHIYSRPPSLGVERPGSPASIESALLRAMSKEPDRRFQTCRAFVVAAREGTGLAAPATPIPGRSTIAESPRRLRPTPAPVAAPTGPVVNVTTSGSRAPWLFATVIALILLAAAGAGVAALLGGRSDADGPLAVTDSVPDADRTSSGPTATATTPTTTQPPLLPIDVSGLPLTTREQDGYAIDLPEDWKVISDDELQEVSEPAVSRRRTQVARPDDRVSLVVDHLTGFDVSPEQNRAQLEGRYADTSPGYRRIGFDEYELGDTRAYEHRYRFLSKKGREARRVTVHFRDGEHDYAVEAAGNAAYDDLSALARRIAGTVVSESDQDDVKAPPQTRSGTYSGVGYESGSRRDHYPIRMRFGQAGDSVDYLDLDCESTLESAGRNGGDMLYDETITRGDCTSGGTWRVEAVSKSRIDVSWSAFDEDFTIKARLSK